MRSCAALLALLLVMACARDARPPNVLLLVVDTLRADHTSLHGYARDTTPEIERWAAGGTVFERASAACSWTTPSMSMLMTGEVHLKNSGRIRPEQDCLAAALERAGYRTGAVVANPLLTHGVRETDGQEGLGFDRGFADYVLRRPPRSRAERNGWTAGEVVERGLAWLAAEDDRPWLLYLHFFDPHDPYEPEGGLRFTPWRDATRAGAFRAALPEEHVALLDDEVYAGIERRIALYDSEVLQVDRALGRLFRWLDERGLTEETLVVLTADHGEGLWQRAATPGEEYKPEAYFPQLYFDHGVQLYGEQVHVPLVFRGPGVEAGRRVTTGVSLLDVLPSVLGRLDLATRSAPDGSDLFAPGGLAPRPIHAVCTRGTTVTVDDRWRLHEPREYRVERFGAVPELYDLERDPLELAPLDDPALSAELRARIAAFRARYGADDGLPEPVSAGQQEDMEKLGYLGEGDEG